MPITGKEKMLMGRYIDIIISLTEKQKKLRTYPKHFHKGAQENVTESDLSDNPKEAIRAILEFARRIIKA